MHAARPAVPPVRCPARLMMLARLLLLLPLLLLAMALPVAAQNGGEELPDFAQWETLAERTEAALADRQTPEADLMTLRAEVAGWRDRFSATQVFSRERIVVLREQIEALGPPPAEGEVEPPELAERRADLNARLANRQAPLLAADEAQRRADAIIRAIDRQLRERQAEALTRLWPTPLNPANWPAGADALVSSAFTVWGEGYNAWLDPRVQDDLRANLPVLLGLLVVALGLLLRGRRWMETLTAQLLRSNRILRGRFVAAFVLSLTQIVVPGLGLVLLAVAVQMTGLAGPTVTDITEAFVAGGLMVVLARWLSLRLFPAVEDPGLNLRLDPDNRRRARRTVLALAMLSAWTLVFQALIQPDQQSDAAVAVLLFPLIALTALALWRMGRLLFTHQPAPPAADAEGEAAGSGPGFVDRAIWVGAKLLLALALVAPVLAAVGYVNAARELLFPAIDSLGLIGLVMVLQRLITAIYETAMGIDEGTSNALFPALAGLVLVLAALPALALLWGVRDTDLLEIWRRFMAGFALGETRISPANILLFFVIFAIGYSLTRGLQGALASSVLPRTTMEKGAQKAVVSGLGYVGLVVAALIAFSTAGIDLSGLAIVAGALSVGIGFGLQNIVSNFISGLILLIERPVAEGDWVEVGPTQGFISRISVRSTVIETFDKSEVIVPNADLISGVVTNYTRTNKTGRVIVPVSVAYGTDTRRVEAILKEIADAHPIAALDPPPAVLFTGFGADGLEFEVRAILRDVGFKMRVASDLRHQIAARFQAEGIEIPFAQRDIWLRNPEVLPGAPPRRAAQGAAPAAAALGALAASGAAALTAQPPAVPPPADPGAPPAPELHEDLADNDGRDGEDDHG